MMHWGNSVAWISLILMILSGILLIAFRRWSHLKWLILYVFFVSITSVLYLGVPAFYNYSYYVTKREIGYLLLIGVVAEIFWKDLKKTPWWLFPAIGMVLVSSFLLEPGGYGFFIPRAFLFIGLAAALPIAIRNNNLPLFTFSFLASGLVISDLLKLISLVFDLKVLEIQFYIDPVIGLITYLILLGGIIWYEIKLLLIKSLTQDIEKVAGWKPAGSLDSIAKTATLATTFSKKDFLSPAELSVYLSMPFEYVENFLEANNIRKVYPLPGNPKWVVLKEDVRKAVKGSFAEFEDFENK